ncbi:hypothetical protein Alg130_09037 [Pyrenophora tritici-repentis]|nr:hypothetical protein PtrV1_07650 [Pyrenophora tritici-repentis]KAF7448704.1 hypothetical protein A1F99_080680 [Pyrenophora tritici-repentis]KAI0571115.1 hypothetical protein Alg215_10611 [Pyrenophora tritici-repentis]KAI0575940.1 hypothetical protein Alg130_09037 [Pyrenophora tritici-repentis]KAI0606726.1 hypothetical protein TUN205_09023 [Pyrenophora tritici-repentis]
MLANLPTTLFLLIATLTLSANAGVQQTDFSGIGRIRVLASDDWQTASPKSSVGCLDVHGKLITDSKDCAVFERMSSFPYTLSTAMGNCTFENEKAEKNTDSRYGKGDLAWSCGEHRTDIYDQLYTITGFPYVFLCSGDIACYYDAKRAPKDNEALSLWQFHWGSEQMGITPGHVQLQLMWEKIGDTPKRAQTSEVLGPRVQINENVQMPLMGKRSK